MAQIYNVQKLARPLVIFRGERFPGWLHGVENDCIAHITQPGKYAVNAQPIVIFQGAR